MTQFKSAQKIILIAGLISFLFAGTVFADTELTVDQAVDLALKKNLSLGRTGIDVNSKKRAKDSMWNVLIPDVETSLTLSRSNETASASGVVPYSSNPVSGTVYDQVLYYSSDQSPYTLSGGMTFRLGLSPATFTGMKLAVSEYEKGLISLENARTVLELNVRKAFYSLLLLEENMKLSEQNIRTSENRYAQAKENYKNGLVPEIDMLSAKVSLENLRPSLDELKISYENQLGNFKIFLGMETADKVSIQGKIEPVLLPPESLNLSPDNPGARLDIQELIAARDSAALSRQATMQQALLPTLSLAYSYSPSLSDPFNADQWGSYSSVTDKGLFSVSVSIPIDNLLPKSAARENINTWDDNLKKQDSQILESARNAGLQTEILRKQLEKSQKTLEALELNVSLAERTYTLTEDAYLQGSKELLTLENAANELQSAKLRVAQEKYNYVVIVLDLEYALGMDPGTLTSTSLEKRL